MGPLSELIGCPSYVRFITSCTLKLTKCIVKWYLNPLKFSDPRNVEYNEVFLLICDENVL